MTTADSSDQTTVSREQRDAQASERRGLARGASATFLGSAFSAAAGFVLVFVVARAMGDVGAGAIMQLIGVFTIVTVLGKIGLDSAALWLLPRFLIDRPDQVRALTYFVVTLASIAGLGGAVVTWGLGTWVFTGASGQGDVGRALISTSWAVPFGVGVLVALAVVRAFGAVSSFVLLGSVGLPGARLLAVAGALAVGASVTAVAQAWAAPLFPIMVVLALVIRGRLRQVDRRSSGHDGVPSRLLPKADRNRLIRFALPRTVSAVLEQGLVWIHVILVGMLAGTAAAGVYGSAARFIAAGMIVDTAIRQIVSPRFSALLHQSRLDDTRSVYRTATRWLVLFATPGFLILIVYADVVLGWLGPEFVEGRLALAVMCGGAMVTFMAGNIHSILLMSGHAGWAAINKAVALGLCVLGCVFLIPMWGIVGAALAWAVATLTDAVLAAIVVRRRVGIHPQLAVAWESLALATVTVAVPAALIRVLLGPDVGALVTSVVVAGTLFLAACFVFRTRLQLGGLRGRAA